MTILTNLSVSLVFVGVSELAPEKYSVSATTVGQIILFLTTLLGIGVQIYRENRARRWAKEDAAELAKKVEMEASKVKEETERVVRHVGNKVANIVTLRADEAHEEREEVKQELKLNTKLTEIAANGGAKHAVEVQKVEVVNDPAHSVPVQEQPKEPK